MDLQQLRVLREVARSGSISAAAAGLDYTQSAVSRQLAALERSVGRRLLDRRARGTRLTDAGELLLARAESILSELEGAEADLAGLDGRESTALRLRAFDSAIAWVVPDAIARLGRVLPDVQIDVRLGSPRLSDLAVAQGSIDVAMVNFGGGDPGPAGAGVRVVPFRDDPLRVVLPAGHPVADAAEVPLHELRGASWIATATTLCADRQLMLDACHAAGFAPRIVVHTDDYATMLGLVACGTGAALVPALALGVLPPGVAVRPLAQPVVRHVAAVVPTGVAPRPGREELIEALRASAAALQGPEHEPQDPGSTGMMRIRSARGLRPAGPAPVPRRATPAAAGAPGASRAPATSGAGPAPARPAAPSRPPGAEPNAMRRPTP